MTPQPRLVTVDPTNGHILAMATSSTYGQGTGQTNFDYATQSHRQTGSAFKVFVLMTLIHDFHGDPDQTYYDSKELLPGWLPAYPTYHVQTSEHSYLGTINVTKATTLSDNTVFAQLAQDVGMDKVTATAHAMGITSPLTQFPVRGAGGGRRLAAGDGRCLRHDRQRRRAHPSHRDHQGGLLRRQRDQPRRSSPHAGVHRRRGIRRHAGAEDGDPERHRDRRRLRLPGGRQDRHDQQLHRRVLRRLHPTARHRGLGRLPELDDVDARRQRPRPRVRRHARGADLARLHVAGEQRVLRRLPDPDEPVQRHRLLRQVRDDRKSDAGPGNLDHVSTSTTSTTSSSSSSANSPQAPQPPHAHDHDRLATTTNAPAGNGSGGSGIKRH